MPNVSQKDWNPAVIHSFILPLSLISTKDAGTASVNSLNTLEQTEPGSLNFCIVLFHPIPIISLQS